MFSLGHKCRHSEYHGNEYYFCINISNFLCQFHSLLKYWRLSVCIEYFFSKCSYILIASLYVSLQFWYGSDFVWTSDIEGNFKLSKQLCEGWVIMYARMANKYPLKLTKHCFKDSKKSHSKCSHCYRHVSWSR